MTSEHHGEHHAEQAQAPEQAPVAGTGLSPELIDLFESDDEGLFEAPVKPRPITSEDRLERAFIEILEFYDKHKRRPDPDTREIAERKLGARLVGILNSEEKKQHLRHLDDVGLLAEPDVPETLKELFEGTGDGSDGSGAGSDFDFFADLLDDDGSSDLYDTASLPKRKPKSSDSVAERTRVKDFEPFRQAFKEKQQQLADGSVVLAEFKSEQSITDGKFYVVRGSLAFVAEVYDPEPGAPLENNGLPKQRLRVVFENGTESSMYRKSFAIRLYEEDGKVLAYNRNVTMDEIGDADKLSGWIYVLRSLSTDPEIASLRDLYKIGYSTTTVEKRIRGAEKSATYLHSPVEIVETFRTYNLRPSALEHLLHRVFAPARLKITRGTEPAATEWFIAPLEAIVDAVDKIISGEIVHYVYDVAAQRLVRRD